MYIYIHTYTYIHIYIYIADVAQPESCAELSHMCTFCTCVHVCMCGRVHVSVFMFIHFPHIHTAIHTYIHTYMHAYIHTYIRQAAYHVHMHTCTHTHTHTSDGMSWVNLNFRFLANMVSCGEQLDVDLYSTMVAAVGVLFGTAVIRFIVDRYAVPWWIRRKASTRVLCMLVPLRRGVRMCVCI